MGLNFFRETARERSRSVEQVAAHAVAASAWVAVVVVVAGPCPCTSIMVVVALAIATNTSTQVGRDGARGAGWVGVPAGARATQKPTWGPLSLGRSPMAALDSRRCQQGPQHPRETHREPPLP